jgi:hyaluronan synthase
MRHRRRGYLPIALAIGLGLIYLFNIHWQALGLRADWRAPANASAFLWLASLIALAYLNPIFKEKPPKLNVCVVATVYNEDPKTFLQMLKSLDAQTHAPNRIYIVDDGSSDPACQKIFRVWAKRSKISAVCVYKTNAGKREAQAVAFRANPKADIFVTIDSDTVLDKYAIEEGLKPFAEPKIMSVAGLLVGLNAQANLLTRLVDVGFVSSFLNGRAAYSRLRSVCVNCGGLAFYRAEVVHKYLDEYLGQTVFGRPALSGDDRILTNFALLDGQTIFQENSIGYTLLPETLSHLTRQRLRWWRSFFWGNYWLIGRFSPRRLIWWLVTWQMICFLIYTVLLPSIILFGPAKTSHLPVLLIAYGAGLSYLRAARYLTIKRLNQSYGQQWVNFLLAPISSLLHLYLCTGLQYVGLATIRRTGWGTRKEIEVGI